MLFLLMADFSICIFIIGFISSVILFGLLVTNQLNCISTSFADIMIRFSTSNAKVVIFLYISK